MPPPPAVVPQPAVVPPPTPPPTQPPIITTTLSITTPPYTTTETISATTNSGVNACVLASTLSATFVILFGAICGLLYYLYNKKKKNSTSVQLPPTTDLKQGSSHSNRGFKADHRYTEAPKREEPLPPKKGGKKEKVSPYHKPFRSSQEEYSVPPTRNESFNQPPLPLNPKIKPRKKKEEPVSPELHEDPNDLYLDMVGELDDVYQNPAEADDIYMNNDSMR